MDDCNFSSYLHFTQPLFQVLGNCSKCSNYHWYHRHFHAVQLFQFSGKIQVFVRLFDFVHFHSEICWKKKFTRWLVLFSCQVKLSLNLCPGLGDLFVFQNSREFYAYIMYQNSQILISWTISSGLPFPPHHAYSCIPIRLVWLILFCE